MTTTTNAAEMPDALSTFISEVEESMAKLKKSLAENPQPCGSRALSFAMQAGLPPRMAYTVSDTAKYTGLEVKTLYEEHDAGHLAFIMPKGKRRGYRVRVDEVDRWMQEN